MTSTPAALQFGRELAAIVGPEHVCEEPSLLTPFAIDGVRPTLAASPGSAEEIAAILRVANEQQLAVTACGGFTSQSLGGIPPNIDVLLRTERLNQILHYDAGDLTIGVAAGIRVADVQSTVAANNLMLPLDVPKATYATIGGTLATASSGPLKHGYGGVREFCIGVTFVTGDGRIAKSGGRVVKNVAGYDLMKLMIGSHGSLGVIVSANFKLFPAPRQTRTFLANVATLDEALIFRRFVQQSPLSPICLEIVSPMAHRYVGLPEGELWTVALRAAGSDAVLARYRRELGVGASRELHGPDEAALWNALQDFSAIVSAKHHNALSLWLHVPASNVAAALTAAASVASDNNFILAAVGRAALASLELELIPVSVDPPAVTQYANAVSALRGALPRDAVAIVHSCPREAKNHVNVWGTSANDLESMRAIKRTLDPKDILNRGRFLF